jgi:hypothetical protein
MTSNPLSDHHHRRRARDLARIAATRVTEGRDHEGALLAWGSDLEVLQESVRRELVERAGQSPADYYQAFEGAFAAGDGDVASEPVATAELARAQARDVALQRLRPMTGDIHPEWQPVPGLDVIPEPTPQSAQKFALSRLEGHSLEEFARLRQAAADKDMRAALGARVKGETVTAIEKAYAADIAATEAYLASSAAAAGDTLLLTLVCRWELILEELRRLEGLPADFAAAVHRVRDTICAALSSADAQRLRVQLPSI